MSIQWERLVREELIRQAKQLERELEQLKLELKRLERLDREGR